MYLLHRGYVLLPRYQVIITKKWPLSNLKWIYGSFSVGCLTLEQLKINTTVYAYKSGCTCLKKGMNNMQISTKTRNFVVKINSIFVPSPRRCPTPNAWSFVNLLIYVQWGIKFADGIFSKQLKIQRLSWIICVASVQS